MGPKAFRASKAKQVLSRISRELGPDAIIISHRKIRDSKGNVLVEATASPRTEGADTAGIPLAAEKTRAKLSSKKLFVLALVSVAPIIVGTAYWQLLSRKTPKNALPQKLSVAVMGFEGKSERAAMRIADVTTNSRDAYRSYLKGKEFYDNARPEDARKFFEKAVELDPGFPLGQLYLALTIMRTDDAAKTREVFEKAKSLSMGSTEKERLYIDAVYTRLIENDYERSSRLLTKLIKDYPKEKDHYFQLGVVYSGVELFYQAIDEFNKALELDPRDAKTLNALGLTYLNMKNRGKAIECFERQLSISPRNAGTFQTLASTYFEIGELDEALSNYEKALEIDPEFLIYGRASYIYALKEHYTEALRWIDRYIATAPPVRNIWGYQVKSFYYFWTGQRAKSTNMLINLTKDLKDTVESKKGRGDASWMLGWIFLDRDEFELSRNYFTSWFNRALELFPWGVTAEASKKHFAAWYEFYLGLVDVEQGKIESARSRLVEIDSLLPYILPRFKNLIQFYYDFLQAEIFLAEGSVDKAIATSQNLAPLGGIIYPDMEVLHNVPFFKDVLARAYRQNGEIDKAIAEYERLTVFDPQKEERYLIHPVYYYRLAELYEQKGMMSEAVAHYEKFLDLWRDADSDLPEILKAKKRLQQVRSFPDQFGT